MRMLKYSPEYTQHATLLAMVPVTLPNAGVCAFNSLSADTPVFRVMLDLAFDQDFQEHGFY